MSLFSESSLSGLVGSIALVSSSVFLRIDAERIGLRMQLLHVGDCTHPEWDLRRREVLSVSDCDHGQGGRFVVSEVLSVSDCDHRVHS